VPSNTTTKSGPDIGKVQPNTAHVEIVDQDVPPRGFSTHCLPPIKNLMPLLFHLPPTEPGEFFSRAAYTGITSSEVSSEASRKRPHVGQLKTPSSLACSSLISSHVRCCGHDELSFRFVWFVDLPSAGPSEPVPVVYIDHLPELVAGTGRSLVPNRFSVVLGTAS
jgi:hypothetical protein